MEDPSPLGLRPASPRPCPLLSLPSDILLILLAYLFPKDRCLLDSAILNHSYRPIFLQSLFDFYDSPSYTQSLLLIKQGCPSQIAWHRFRKLSIKRIRIWSSDETWSDHLRTFQSTLTHISLLSQHLIYSELDILRECPHLQVLEFCQCRLPASYTFTEHIRQFSQVPSIRIETYFNYSTDFQYVRTSTVVTGLSFPSIFCLYLTRLNVVDVELRSIFLACSSLQSLHLIDVAIEDETLLLLPTICPSLRTVHIRQCERVSFEAMLSILRHYTIPNLMNLDPPKLEVEIDSFREGLSLIIQTHSPDVVISRDLMKRLLSLLKPHCSSALIRSISSLFYLISMSYFGFFILEFSVLPLFFKLYTSIPELALLDSILRIVTSLLVQESHHAQIVSQRILAFLASVQQEHRHEKRFEIVTIIDTLGPLMADPSTHTAPIEDWISCSAYLVDCFLANDLPFPSCRCESFLQNLCMSATTQSHVQLLIENHMVRYWEHAFGSELESQTKVCKVLRHLISIDETLPNCLPDSLQRSVS